MRIVVKKRIPLVFAIPNRLLCSPPVTAIIASAMQKDGVAINRRQLAPLLRQCCEIFRQYHGLSFVEVRAADGTQVKLTL